MLPFMFSCIEDKTVTVLQETPESLTTTFTFGSGDQNRVLNTGYWSDIKSRSITDFSIVIPTPDANNIVIDNNNKNLPMNLNNTNIYITVDLDNFEVPNAGSGNNVHIVDGVTVKWNSQNTGNIANVYNEGNLVLGDWFLQSNNVESIHNKGYIEVGTGSQWVSFSSGHNIWSDGIIEVNCQQLMLESNIEATKLIVNGNLKVQTGSTTKDICEVECSGTTEVVTHLTVGKITAKNIKFDGAKIFLHPEGYVYAEEEIDIPNSGCEIKAHEGSTGVVETKKLSLHLVNSPLNVTFQAGVYLEVEELFDTSSWSSVALDNLYTGGGKVNSGHVVYPSCGATPEVREPSLDEIASVESPTHNHDADKTKRHLSASCLTFYNGDIYASYHMRGYNWGTVEGDLDKDDIEGCIEKWSFSDEGIKISNWLWTNEFDFNHLIVDNGKIIAVGHKGSEKTDFGAIVTYFPVSQFNYTQDAEGNEVFTNKVNYRYLVTNVRNEEKKDWENAGDGNCIIPYNGNYLFAASRGYGLVDRDSLYRTEETPVFVETPGSVKYVYGNKAIYLDKQFTESTKEDEAGMYITNVFDNNSKYIGQVNPVDGKNVLFDDYGLTLVCLGTNGLYVNGIIYNDFHGPVNGVTSDGNYIYIANGIWISVYDTNMNLIIERKCDSDDGISANFVEVNGNYVFVAFGQAGIKVYKLNV